MAKEPTKETAMEDLQRAFGQALALLVKMAVKEGIAEVFAKQPEVAGPAAGQAEPVDPEPKSPKKATKPQVVTPAPEEDVTEEALRTRAGDICALKPDGTAKAKCAEIVKKLCGGKIADLKTPKQRIDCLAAFDQLYNELAA